MNYLLHQLKFGQAFQFANLIGRLMAQAWRHSGQPTPEAIIPVPLHRERLRTRGYNQAAAIGKQVARCLDIPFEPRLVGRCLATQAQATLNATARQRNMRGAFTVLQAIPYQRVALLDDVMTTGATLHELAFTLKQSGVVWVEAWAACRAQRGRR